LEENKNRIFDILNTAKKQQITGYRSMMSSIVLEDRAIANMSTVRVNANRQMDKFRLQQEEIENHKKRLKNVDINDYLTRKRTKSTFGSV